MEVFEEAYLSSLATLDTCEIHRVVHVYLDTDTCLFFYPFTETYSIYSSIMNMEIMCRLSGFI